MKWAASPGWAWFRTATWRGRSLADDVPAVIREAPCCRSEINRQHQARHCKKRKRNPAHFFGSASSGFILIVEHFSLSRGNTNGPRPFSEGARGRDRQRSRSLRLAFTDFTWLLAQRQSARSARRGPETVGDNRCSPRERNSLYFCPGITCSRRRRRAAQSYGRCTPGHLPMPPRGS